MTANALDVTTGRVGIVMTPMPSVTTSLPGASCLLCIAAASAANSSLSNYAKTLPVEELPRVKELLAELLRKRGADVLLVPIELNVNLYPPYKGRSPNAAPFDFATLGQQHKIDKLIVVDFSQVGFERTYSSYFPTSAPKGIVRGSAYLVDMKDQQLLWYNPVSVARAADGDWDEPPRFPGLTNAYFQALEDAKDDVLAPFKP